MRGGKSEFPRIANCQAFAQKSNHRVPSVESSRIKNSFSIYDHGHKDFVKIRFGEEKTRRNADGQS